MTPEELHVIFQNAAGQVGVDYPAFVDMSPRQLAVLELATQRVNAVIERETDAVKARYKIVLNAVY